MMHMPKPRNMPFSSNNGAGTRWPEGRTTWQDDSGSETDRVDDCDALCQNRSAFYNECQRRGWRGFRSLFHTGKLHGMFSDNLLDEVRSYLLASSIDDPTSVELDRMVMRAARKARDEKRI